MSDDRNLANKYRPQVFDDLVGQEEVKLILKKQIEEDNLRSAYLFFGSAGCGKTTSARCMARSINGSLVGLVEIDAASNSGVDSVRELTELSKFKPIGYKKKIYIVDECFHKDTLINTPKGYKKISDISIGDFVYNMDGVSKVTNVFENIIPIDRLCLVNIGGKEILTTIDHLFFTTNGWIEARNLSEGDVVVDYEGMSVLWETVSDKQQGQEVLFETMYDRCTEEGLSHKEVSELWKGISKQTQRSEVLLPTMFRGLPQEESETSEYGNSCMSSMQEGVSSSVWEQTSEDLFLSMQKFIDRKNTGGEETSREFQANEGKQSNVQPRICSKNDRYQKEEWNIQYVERGESRREWEVYSTPITSTSKFGRGVDYGVCDTDKMSERATSISYMLQSRPRVTKIEDSSRGGWCNPSKEIPTIIRFKENPMSKQLRVEGVKIYKRGDNDRYFTSYLTDRERDSGFIKLYDLEIEGHPSYFVDDLLVHNCHSLSSQGWQAFLKTIEDGVKDVIFIFCTTERHKVPATIISRCQVFDFKRIRPEDVKKRLNFIQDSENKEFEECKYKVSDECLDYISRMANGGMRLAISMYEKVINYNYNPTIKEVAKILGTASYDIMYDLMESVYDRKPKNLVVAMEELNLEGVDFKLVMKDFVDFNLELLKYNLTKDSKYTTIPEYYLKNRDSLYGVDFLMEINDALLSSTNEIKGVDDSKNYMLGKLLQLC